jgi:hypothetical protein
VRSFAEVRKSTIGQSGKTEIYHMTDGPHLQSHFAHMVKGQSAAASSVGIDSCTFAFETNLAAQNDFAVRVETSRPCAIFAFVDE